MSETLTRDSATITAAVGAGPDPVRAARPRRRVIDRSTVIVFGAVALVLAIIVVWPIAELLLTGASADGLATIVGTFTHAVDRRALLNTLVLGLLTGVFGTLIGLCFAFAQVRLAFRGRRLVHLIALLPVVAPPFAIATAVIVQFGRKGLISNGLFHTPLDVYGLPGLVLVMSLSFSPIAYLTIRGMLMNVDASMEEAAANLGANRFRVFRTVTLPMIFPGIAGSFLFLFVEAISDLANPLIIGGDYSVLASRVYFAINGDFSMTKAAAYSIVLLIPALLVFVLQHYWVGKRNVVSVTGKPSAKPTLITAPALRIPVLTIVALVSALIVLVFLTVIVGGFIDIIGVKNTFTLDHYRQILTGRAPGAFLDTAVLAVIAAPISGLLGTLIAWLVVRKLGRRLGGVVDFIGMLGVAVPGIVLGLGYAIAFSVPYLVLGVKVPALAGGNGIAGGAIAILLVYIVFSLPAGQRSSIAAISQIHPAIEEASTSLGAGSLRTFVTTTLPLLRPALIAGVSYAIARSMTALTPIIFVTTPRTHIVSAQLLDEVDTGRFGNAFAYCTLLIAVVLGFMGLLNLALRRWGTVRTDG
ncbi:ABC transporter permease [Microbacterium gorillae]|uniref:ABC transporter permease n=1 Tax=Microbacterium gorillae TaxID=1231063 RepID=UPI000A4736AB|nr:iron ABC transporter permease [Microbacterium gorillae]